MWLASNRVSKYMKQNIIEIKEKIGEFIIIFDNSHIPFPGTDRTSRQKIEDIGN